MCEREREGVRESEIDCLRVMCGSKGKVRERGGESGGLSECVWNVCG